VKVHRLLLIPLCLTLLVLTTAGFRACSAEEKHTLSRNVTSGLSAAARAVEPGIETVRAFREAGKVEPATSLALARLALDANGAAAALAKSALDGADAPTLAARLDIFLRLAVRLESEGTLHLKNGETRLAFDLGVVAAKSGLVAARDQLNGPAPAFTLDDETRRKLEELMPVFEKNDRLLREAVARLSPTN
jgi:hypothetical protein